MRLSIPGMIGMWSAAISTAYAQPFGHAQLHWLDESHSVARLDRIDGEVAHPDAIFESYDNWRSPSYGSGLFQITGVQRVGGHEFGDDLGLVNNSPGAVLDGTGISMSNMANSGSLTSVRFTYRWYDIDTIQLLQTYSFLVIIGFDFQAGRTDLIEDTDGDWRFLNLHLPDHLGFSIQFSNATGISTDDLGMAIGGPRNTGTSSRFIRDYSAAQDLDLGSDQTNFAMYMHTYAVPAPGSLGVLLSSVLAASRRPRRMLNR